ncbi:MAG: hypothetical protein U1E17_09790 [Geminicoccaceae bacterium]
MLLNRNLFLRFKASKCHAHLRVLTFLPLLAGCSSVIFERFDADQGSVSMDARQRTIVSVERGTGGEKHRVVCAEPSPDALATATASVGLSAGISGVPHLAGGGGQIAGQGMTAEQAAYIGMRNATIQLLRDGLYRACEAYMNGALGDFGYGLVLVNYGKLMVSLITAEGLARPPFAPSVTIGTIPGASSASVQGNGAQGAAPKDNKPAAGGAQGGAGGEGAAASPAKATAQKDASQSVPAPTPINWAPVEPINEHSEHIFKDVILPLANPTQDPVGKFIEVAVACMLWMDNSGAKKPPIDSGEMQKFCTLTLNNLTLVIPEVIKNKMASNTK